MRLKTSEEAKIIKLYKEHRVTVLQFRICLVGLQQRESGNVTFKTSTYKITKKKALNYI